MPLLTRSFVVKKLQSSILLRNSPHSVHIVEGASRGIDAWTFSVDLHGPLLQNTPIGIGGRWTNWMQYDYFNKHKIEQHFSTDTYEKIWSSTSKWAEKNQLLQWWTKLHDQCPKKRVCNYQFQLTQFSYCAKFAYSMIIIDSVLKYAHLFATLTLLSCLHGPGRYVIFACAHAHNELLHKCTMTYIDI